MRLNFKLQQQGLILVMIPVLVGTVFIGMLWHLLKEADEENMRQVNSKLTVAAAGDMTHHLMEAAVCLVRFRSTHSNEPIQEFDKTTAELPAIYQQLESLSKSRPQTSQLASKLEETCKRLVYLMSNFRRPKDPTEFLLTTDERYRHQVHEEYQRFMSEFDDLRKQEGYFQNLHTDQASRDRVNLFLIIGVAANFIVAWVLSFFFSKKITDRLAVLTDNNWRLARREPLNRLVAGSDEISELDKGFHQMADALLRAEARKQEFVQMISHDLRTPLTSIQGTLALASRGSFGQLNDKGIGRVADAEEDTERLINMINELLDIEKMEAGKLELDCTKVSLAEIVDRSIESVRTFAETHGVTVTREGEDATVDGDKDRLIRVVINLVSNAIKYSPSGSFVFVRIAKESGIAIVRVCDKGRGIPAQAVTKIFDRFSQVEKTDAKKGTGLGLAICKAIVEAHAGKIGVESSPDAGTTFWFTLKLDEAQAQPQDERVTSASSAS
ncbi:MAG TPA: HAMP domain-containing sensor histidine kinase [Trichormus sp.]|jgi:signal transduction histidine kinase